jgi:hypothetical protein
METTERWVRREVRAMTRREVITKAIPGQYLGKKAMTRRRHCNKRGLARSRRIYPREDPNLWPSEMAI